ncbi:MAG: hypothetical protein M5U28_54020 [Sandaracinaceae bacterium]|nr:hypothetical protein [Sandaracinaceae bacterium]
MRAPREAFARGIACVEQHETACAERAFREALALHDAPTIRYNLASALFDLGRYPEAARLAAAVTADAEAPAEVRDHAETLLEQLRAQGAVLSLTLEGATDGVTVQLDGEEVPASQQGEILVAPGRASSRRSAREARWRGASSRWRRARARR